jgi:CRISPR/Cas system-associated exonuclease Cas4 (RecB family)
VTQTEIPEQTQQNVRNISNSELAAWLQCERKYYYNFDLGIEPKTYGSSLARGMAGHTVLEAFYQSLVDSPADFDAADQRGNAKLNELLSEGSYDIEVLTDLQRLFARYFPYVREHDYHWKILAVERSFNVPLMAQFQYAMKLDVLARIGNEIVIVDHKFVYDFYKQAAVDMMPQLPKYIATLRANGLAVDKGVYNMLRWRMKKGPMQDNELFERITVKPHPNVLVNVMREQMLGSQQILAHRELPIEQRDKAVLRTMNKLNCQNCQFNPLCIAELHGHDITVDIQNNYQKSEYVSGLNDEGA